MKNAGIHQNKKKYITHSTLHYKNSAAILLSKSQKIILIGILIIAITSLILNWHTTLLLFFSFLVVLYFCDLLFNFLINFKSFVYKSEINVTKEEVENLPEESLPKFSVLCPLYKESAVLEQFINAMSSLDYPKEKLEVLLLLEEDDTDTINKAKSIDIPGNIHLLPIPYSQPRTKPKALNYGLANSSGDLVVIYDAEDIPETDQLKKAVIAFEKAGKDVFCLQAKLNFYNSKQNFLTRMFAAEYSTWFDLLLPGLYAISAPIPLGGTSNIFRKNQVDKLEGWDAFNVCEDCDLGLRLFKKGYNTALFNSTTYEEANSNLGNWIRQRSHWIKGYIQAFFVHIRQPQGFVRSLRQPHIISFLIIVGGKTSSVFINPFLWIMTISYFLFRPEVGSLIASFYPRPIFYMGLFTLIFGNFIYLYSYMLGAAKRGYWNLIIYCFFAPIYWLLMSFAAWKALYQLIVKPFYWEKTTHGLHLNVNSVSAS